MTIATKLGELWRRDASLGSVRNVRQLDEQRLERHGASSGELNERFARRVAQVESRVAALESEVLGKESLG